MKGYVYLLHLAEALGSERHQAGHYLGWCADDPYRRLIEHLAGRGAKMLAAANERGIDYWIVRTWPGGRELERQLKRRKEGPALCPLCRSERKRQRYQLPMPWARAEYEALQFTLADVPEMRF
jgi:hypothetical protein